jgi:hypothetical protein
MYHRQQRLLLILTFLLGFPMVVWAASGYLLDRKSMMPKVWIGEEELPECTDGDIILWATSEGGTTGEWQICGAVTGETPSLQQSHAIGDVGGWTDLLESRPLTIWPEHDTLGVSAPRIRYYGESGHIIRECTYGDPADEPCQPETTHIPIGTSYRITYTGDSPPTELEAGTLQNIDGVLTTTGVFSGFGASTLTVVTPGGEDTAAISTVGSPGPQSSSQHGWVQLGLDTDGTPLFIPVWK